MRRTLASVLLLLISYTLITPLLFAEPESKIAACCRRDGKHHCAKMAATQPNDDVIRITAATKCPMFPPSTSSPVSGDVAVPEPVPAVLALLVSASAPAQQCEVERRIAESRAWRKRGPPSLLA